MPPPQRAGARRAFHRHGRRLTIGETVTRGAYEGPADNRRDLGSSRTDSAGRARAELGPTLAAARALASTTAKGESSASRCAYVRRTRLRFLLFCARLYGSSRL